MKKPLQKIIIIAGPTATGKTSLSITLAKKYSAEIISADSRQVYKGLDIGSAKVTKEEMKGVPHHLLDVAEPSDVFSVSDFKTQGKKAINKILDKGNLPIVCGGTGFYIDTLIYDNDFPEVPANPDFRMLCEQRSKQELYSELSKKAPLRAANIDMNNKVRVIRALEIYEALGHIPEIRIRYDSPYDILYIGLKREKELHLKDVDKRITQRIEQGMIKEVSQLNTNGISWERLESFGLEYRFIAQYLQGKLTLEESVNELSKETRRFIKRQYTWFNKNPHVQWFNPDNEEALLLQTVNEFLEK
jgi:tRNA dimethylallyltransferase